MRHAAVLVVLAILVAYLAFGNPFGAPGAGDCDRLAADPDDIHRMAVGVPDAQMVPELAIKACSAAVSKHHDEARFYFQLGRGLQLGGRPADAADAFDKSASMNYAPAKFFVAKQRLAAYWAAANEDDDETARAVLEDVRARLRDATEFRPAADMLNRLTLQPSDFRLSLVSDALVKGDFAWLNRGRMFVALWALGVHEAVSMHFHPDDQACPAYLSNPAITRALDAAVVGDPRNPIEGALYRGGTYLGSWLLAIKDTTWLGNLDKWKEWFKSIGMHDGLMLSKRYGCDSPATREFYRGLVRFAGKPQPLKNYYQDLVGGRTFRQIFPEIAPLIDGPWARVETTEPE